MKIDSRSSIRRTLSDTRFVASRQLEKRPLSLSVTLFGALRDIGDYEYWSRVSLVRKDITIKEWGLCGYECGRRAASCLFIRNIRWEMRAGEKSKEQGICLFHFSKKYACGRFEAPAGHWRPWIWTELSCIINIFALNIFLYLFIVRWGMLTGGIVYLVGAGKWKKEIIGKCQNMTCIY